MPEPFCIKLATKAIKFLVFLVVFNVYCKATLSMNQVNVQSTSHIFQLIRNAVEN